MSNPANYATRPTLVFRAKSMVPPPLIDSVVISLAALIIALFLFGLFVLCKGVNPLDVYTWMLRGSFYDSRSWDKTVFDWQKTLTYAWPIMLTALCVALPARVGMVVIGGEGCVLLGGLMAALVGNKLGNAPTFVIVPAMVIAGMTVGGLWITMVGALRQFRGVNETISSLLLNYIALAILNHCVEGPMRDPLELDHPSSVMIGQAAIINIWWGLIFGVVVCLFAWVLMDHTTHGFATSIVGGNVRAARIAGLSVAKFSLIACFLGGAAAALTGVVQVAAVHKRANDSLSAGYGYSGILVAFIARQNPLAIIPVAILLGGVSASGDLLQLKLHLSSASLQVFQGMLFLLILGLDTWSGRMKELRNIWPKPKVARGFDVAKPTTNAGVANVGT
jgi:general nucleoside transport system permease protein